MPDVQRLNLPPLLEAPDPETALYLEAAMEWVEKNTRYRFADGEEIPSGVKLFLVKYAEVMGSGLASGVQSESLGGMSQTFASGAGDVVRALAEQLLGQWYSGTQFIPAQARWH